MMSEFAEFQKRKGVESNPLFGVPNFHSFRNLPTNFILWYPEFSKMRNNAITEAIIHNKIHDDDDIRPLNLSKEHEEAISHYTSTPSESKHGYASSGNVNAHLHIKSGDSTKYIVGNHDHHDLDVAVSKLSSVFTPENTNKRKFVTHGAIPREYGEKFEGMKIGDIKVAPAFTSTTTDLNTAFSHSKLYTNVNKDGERHDHIIDYTLHPGVGVSVVNHSDYAENEILLNKDSKMKYMGTTTEKVNDKHYLKTHNIEVLKGE